MNIKKIILTLLVLALLALPFWLGSLEPKQKLAGQAYICQGLNVPCSLPVTFKGWPQ